MVQNPLVVSEMLSDKIECLSGFTSNPWDLNVTEYQTSNPMAPSSFPNITGEPFRLRPKIFCLQALHAASCYETQVPRNEQVQVQDTAAIPLSSETQTHHTDLVQASATIPSPSETQVLCNEQVQDSAISDTQAPRNGQFQATSAFLLPSETQAPRNNQVQLTVAAPLAPVKKSMKMRPGSMNTARQAFIQFSILINSQYSNIRGLCSIDWCGKNPRGTAAEFKIFYDNLHQDELKVREQCIFLFLCLFHASHQKYEDLAKMNRVSLTYIASQQTYSFLLNAGNSERC
jgi:hypothetical protein